jgi:hypothetical protein
MAAHAKESQGDGIRTRTVRVTGGDANFYITTLEMEPMVGLAPAKCTRINNTTFHSHSAEGASAASPHYFRASRSQKRQ